MSNYKTIGILGGMGPMATYDLGVKIIENTDASCDQDHIPVLIDCNTKISDRTAAILRGGDDPLPEIIRSARRLESAGADLLIMPCNTAHYYYDDIASEIGIDMLNMPEETARRLSEIGVGKAGVLATDGTLQTGIYDKALRREGIEPVYPSEDKQRIIMSLIYDHVKAGDMDLSSLDIAGVIEEIKDLGAEIMILGCTELPIAFDHFNNNAELHGHPSEGGGSGSVVSRNKEGGQNMMLPVIDPAIVLARAAIAKAGGRLSGI